jgi:hypothetical protein
VAEALAAEEAPVPAEGDEEGVREAGVDSSEAGEALEAAVAEGAVEEDMVSEAAEAAEDEGGSRTFHEKASLLHILVLLRNESKHFNKSRRGCLGAREGPVVVLGRSLRLCWAVVELARGLETASSCWGFRPDGAGAAAVGAEIASASATERSRRREGAPVWRTPHPKREPVAFRRQEDSECPRTRRRRHQHRVRGSCQKSDLAAAASARSAGRATSQH